MDFKVHVGIFFGKPGNIRHDGIYGSRCQTDTQDPFFTGLRHFQFRGSCVFQEVAGTVIENLAGLGQSDPFAGAVKKFYI